MAVAGLIVVLTGCANSSTTGSNDRLIVFADSSLGPIFGRFAHQFEVENPGAHVSLVIGDSAELANKIDSGSPADIFASGSSASMQSVSASRNVVTAPRPFATNRLIMVTPVGNRTNITQVDDLARLTTSSAMCVLTIPCGVATSEMLRKAKVNVEPQFREPSSAAVLTRVIGNKVQVGIVYKTDAVSAGAKVGRVGIPIENNVINDYQIAALRGTGSPTLASLWIGFVQDPIAQTQLRAAGFG